MKKILFPLLTLVLAVVTFASCSSNNDDKDGGSSSTTTYYQARYVIGNDMAELGTYTLTISDGTKTSEYDLVKNGKQITYNFSSLGETPAYEFSITQPSEKKLTFTVTYTPNAKAKALTDNEKANVYYAKGYGTATSSAFNITLTGGTFKGVKGSHVIELIQTAAKDMSKAF